MAITREELKKYAGKYQPTGSDFATWDELKWLSFIDFCKIFIDTVTQRWSVKRRNLASIMDTNNPFWMEFLVRLDVEEDPEVKNFRGFPMKFASMRNRCFKFLDTHPHVVTDKMREETVSYPAMSWATKPEMLNLAIPIQQDPERSYQKALSRSLDLFHEVANSISEREIAGMETPRKFDALRNLNQIFVAAKAYAPRSKVFLNFNIDKAGVEEIEKKLLSYSEEQEEDS